MIKPQGPKKREETKRIPEGQTIIDAVPAEVVEIVGRTGMRGEATQVRCKVLLSLTYHRIWVGR